MIDELGLVSSAKWFVEGLGQRSGIEVSLDAPAVSHDCQLPLNSSCFADCRKL